MQHPQAVGFFFKGAGDGAADVFELGVLAPEPLRQWLNILHHNDRSSGWPMQVWPDAVTHSVPAPATGPVLVH